MIPVVVVIVESHQHALEHVHDVLRKQRKKMLLSLGGQEYWSMLHFDAHPDLACPAHVPAAACFAPRRSTATTIMSGEDTTTSSSSKTEEMDDSSNSNNTEKNLYELLDETTSGIAEWILPLVLAGNLRHIEWVKPSFSHQLQVGDYRYSVGVDVMAAPHLPVHRGQQDANAAPTSSISSNNKSAAAAASGCFLDLPDEARIKVDWGHPYYLDDDVVVPTDSLVLKQTLHLRVSELPITTANTITTTTASERDSSSTQHYHSSNHHQMQEQQPWMLDICLDYFACHNPYLTDIERICPIAAQTLVDIMQTTKMMQQQQQAISATREMDHAEGLHYQRDVTTFVALLKDILQCGSLTPHIAGQLDKYFCLKDRANASDLIGRLLQAIGGNATLREMVMEALPNNWSMPHAPKSLAEDHLKDSLRMFEQAVVQRAKDNNNNNNEPPFLITIARSTNDGFTPASVVEFLQSEILLILERIFAKNAKGKGRTSRDEIYHNQGNDYSDNYQLRVVRDYGEWEGSTIYDL